MKRLVTGATFMFMLSIILANPAMATVDLDLSYYSTAAPGPVSVVTTPNGAGYPLSAAYLYGGAIVDATITVVLIRTDGEPEEDYAREDIWLETSLGGLFVCFEGAIADDVTDESGTTTFSDVIHGGGYTDPANELTQVIVDGMMINQPGLDIQFNGPDMDGDGIFNLADVPLAAETYFSGYHYRLDFFWDGVINLSDVASYALLVSSAYGAGCE